MTRASGMDFKNRFSFPINHVEIFRNKAIDVNWFAKHSDVINEIYIDPGFLEIETKDMNGANVTTDPSIVKSFLEEIKQLDIKVCVIFNDVFEKDDTLLERVQAAVAANKEYVDIVVVPDKSWLVLKELGLEVKNTVINLPTYEQVRDGEFDEYDCIYIHDEIIHNHDLYKDIKGNRRFGTVVNYGDCATNCRLKDKHYYLVKIGKYDANLFCKTVKWGPLELLLKRNSIPTFRSEFDHYLDVIDIYKLQGRNTTGTFKTAVEIVEGIVSNQEIFSEYQLVKDKLNPITLIKWKNQIRNCGGDCDNCDYCDKILEEVE
jgi:hypothetical protein